MGLGACGPLPDDGTQKMGLGACGPLTDDGTLEMGFGANGPLPEGMRRRVSSFWRSCSGM